MERGWLKEAIIVQKAPFKIYIKIRSHVRKKKKKYIYIYIYVCVCVCVKYIEKTKSCQKKKIAVSEDRTPTIAEKCLLDNRYDRSATPDFYL